MAPDPKKGIDVPNSLLCRENMGEIPIARK